MHVNQRRVRHQRKGATRESVDTILSSAAEDERIDKWAHTATSDNVEGLGLGLGGGAALSNLSVINEGSETDAAIGADSAIDDENPVEGIVTGRNLDTSNMVEDVDTEIVLPDLIKESEKPPFVRKENCNGMYCSVVESTHSTAGQVKNGEEVTTDNSITISSTQEVAEGTPPNISVSPKVCYFHCVLFVRNNYVNGSFTHLFMY